MSTPRVHVCAERGARSTMEDRHIVDTEFMQEAGVSAQLFAVFDGHGGSHVAAHLEKHFAPALKRFLLPWKGLESVEAALRNSFSECNNEIRCMLEEQSCYRSGGGSTAVVALIIDKRWLFVANCGDAEAVLWKSSPISPGNKVATEKNVGQGTLVVATVSHKPESERQRIEDCGGFVVYGRVSGMLAVSRSFGDFEFCNSESDEQFVIADPHVSRHEIVSDGVLIVACDGLWDVFSHADAVSMALVGSEEKSNDVARLLVDTAIKMRRSQDNVTTIVVFFGDSTDGTSKASIVGAELAEVNASSSSSSTFLSASASAKEGAQGNGLRACAICGKEFAKSGYSSTQWRRGCGRSKCVSCASAAAAAAQQ